MTLLYIAGGVVAYCGVLAFLNKRFWDRMRAKHDIKGLDY